ncbi:MAG: HAD-IC family P-type ATPase, partial [archaeon]|nr:HAD-IC family P-type ATPase [archaeon]
MGIIKEAVSNQTKELFMVLYATLMVLTGLSYDYNISEVIYFLLAGVALIILPVYFGTLTTDDNEGDLQGSYMALCSGVFALVVLVSLFNPSLSVYVPCVAVMVCGVPIILGAVEGVVKDHDITVDLLVSVAIVACILTGEYLAAAEISIIMQIGSFLEEATVSHANGRIAYLNRLMPTVAHVVNDGRTVTLSADRLEVGQTVRVLPGETVPADGRVSDGTSSIDMSMITGESVPRDVKVGDTVSAGTVNMFGSIDVIVEKVGKDSTISRMSSLLDEADAGKSRIVRVADRWATYIVVMAFSIAVLAYLFTGDITRSVTVLVVFCPCALILATPTALMAAAGNMGRHGILLRDGGAVERLARV